jgi:D-tyrosyl-tRNA(Tyr) deacylase
MTVVIVTSTEDPASTNIKKCLLEQSSWDEVESFDNIPVYRYSKMKDVIIVTIRDRKIRHENLDRKS